MCGICGIINRNSDVVEEKTIKKMMAKLKHRGPDDEGSYINRNIGLGHVRLSVIDLSKAGRQPMFDSTRRYCILHNGEVYNYLELRNQLEGEYDFSSHTDTEVILYSYIKWGRQCLDRFNGMFAFVVYDTKNEELFIARDRYGIKPMYYFIDNNRFVFASEIDAILEIAPEKRMTNDAAIFDYLVFNRTDQSANTFFRGIRRVEHGYCGIFRDNEIIFEKWYDLPGRVAYQSVDDGDFKKAFIDGVNLRLRSDVPVGVCLSGGLDSASITCVITDILGKNDLQTFSTVYGKGAVGDESQYADLLADRVFDMHKTMPTAYSLLDDLVSFIACHGEPVSSTGPYAQYKVMQLAQGKVKVLLDGQGGDELLAGYHYFFGTYLKQLLSYTQLMAFLRELNAYYKRHRSMYALQSLMFYYLPNALKSRARLFGRNYISYDFYEQQKNNTTLPETLFNARTLQEALVFHFAYKLEHLLKWEDRNSMWFSLESRVPFLDYRLVEYTLALAPDRIIHNGETKYVLRQAMQGIIPEEIRLRQDKVGFMTPEADWFRTPGFNKLILELLNSESFRRRPYFDQKKCLKLYDAHIQRKINISRDVWKWINLELWLRRLES
jgi:asparagine synthase (glutamine-hydrolysing)